LIAKKRRGDHRDRRAVSLFSEIGPGETFTGDIDGESTVRALEMRRDGGISV
jgi:hypothetical protein